MILFIYVYIFAPENCIPSKYVGVCNVPSQKYKQSKEEAKNILLLTRMYLFIIAKLSRKMINLMTTRMADADCYSGSCRCQNIKNDNNKNNNHNTATVTTASSLTVP